MFHVKHIGLFIFILNHCFGNAQILHVNPKNQKEHLFTSAAHFNPLFVKRNKIKSVEVSVAYKDDLKPIKQTQLKHFYHFNNQGVLYKQLETYQRDFSSIDTIYTEYIFNSKNKIIKEIRKDKKGYFTYDFDYDSNGQKEKMTYSKIISKNDVEQPIIIFSETFKNEIQENRIKTHIINDLNIIYKEETITSNALNQITNKSNNLKTSRIGKSFDFIYNDFGRVTKMNVTQLPQNELKGYSAYMYDNLGNLIQEDIYKSGELKVKKEYLYDDRLLLKAELSTDQITKKIKIYKLTYTFW